MTAATAVLTELEPPPTRKQTTMRRLKQSRVLIVMCLPALIYFLVFAYGPMPGSWIAFTN